MTFCSLSQSLLELREFVCGGAETLLILYHIDQLLQTFSSLENIQSLQMQQLQQELKSLRKTVKKVQKENTSLKETLGNLRSDFEMTKLKSQKLQENLVKYQTADLKT